MKLKMQVFGGPWKAPWHYYSNVFGVYIVPKLEIVPGPLGGSVLASKRPPFLSRKSINFSKGRPRGVLELPKMAQKAKRKGSKNGSQKRSAKNQVNRKNRAAAAPRRRGSRSMGRDIGRGKPLP